MSQRSASSVSTRSRRRGFLLLAAALVIGTGVASAGIYTWQQRGDHARVDIPAQPKPMLTAPIEPDDIIRAARGDGGHLEPSEQTEAVIENRADNSSRDSSVPPVMPPTSGNVTPAPSAAKLIERANRHRKARAWRRAEDTYLRVIKLYPKSSAADVARVAAASIRLEHLRDARGAIRLYRAALRRSPQHVLSEEARWGLARAYRRVGNRAGERRTLTELERQHPDSPLIDGARQRLRQLDDSESQP